MFNLIIFLGCFFILLFSTFTIVNLPFISFFSSYDFSGADSIEVISKNFFFTIGFFSGNLQIPAVILSAIVLKPRLSFFFISTYLLLGFSGVPIFYFGGGTEYFSQPSAGYVLAFLPLVFFISNLCWRKDQERFLFNSSYVFSISLIGLLIMHFGGIIYAFVANFNFNTSFYRLFEIYFAIPFFSQFLLIGVVSVIGANFNRYKTALLKRYQKFIAKLYKASSRGQMMIKKRLPVKK